MLEEKEVELVSSRAARGGRQVVPKWDQVIFVEPKACPCPEPIVVLVGRFDFVLA